MGRHKYSIELKKDELETIYQIINETGNDERVILRAKILLMSDGNYEPKLSVIELAQMLDTTHTTVQTTRAEYEEGGLDKALYRKTREVSMKTRKINEDVIRQIREIAAGDPPAGYKKWSLRLLCNFCMEKGIVEHIVPASMGKILKEQEQNKPLDKLSKGNQDLSLS